MNVETIDWINYAKSDKDETWRVQLMVEVDDVWYWMQFEESSSASFDAKAIDWIILWMKDSDRKQLVKIIGEMRPTQQVKFLKKIFPKAASKIDDKTIKKLKE